MNSTTRCLNHEEFQLARHVFRGTIPYKDVRVTPLSGIGDPPYTLVFTGGQMPFDDSHPVGGGRNRYHLNVGSMFSGMALDSRSRLLLIHELTHVWQSCHGAWPASYIFNSLANRAIYGEDAAYRYEAGKPWDAYNVEQQAKIVEDWFARGQLDRDPLYPYIRDHIRAAKQVK